MSQKAPVRVREYKPEAPEPPQGEGLPAASVEPAEAPEAKSGADARDDAAAPALELGGAFAEAVSADAALMPTKPETAEAELEAAEAPPAESPVEVPAEEPGATVPTADPDELAQEASAVASAFDQLALEGELLTAEEQWLEQVTGEREAQTTPPVHAEEDDEPAARAYIDEGNAFYAISAFELAEHRYARAVEAAAGFADAYYNRANARVRLGELDG
ncbi:MAG TPA: hypothetical protein QGF35_09145, partial [Dehalococcoidia bacterium]|nr:hypothetical protein [Dehalococcoidia bacterium]